MHSIFFQRLRTLALVLLGLGVLTSRARADLLEPGTAPKGSLALRGGQVTGTELRAFVYAPSTKPAELAVKFDGAEQPEITTKTFKDAAEPVDVVVVVQLAKWLRAPGPLKELKDELNKLAVGVYGTLGGKMGLVAYNTLGTCIPEPRRLQNSTQEFASVVDAFAGFKVDDSGVNYETGKALDCAMAVFAGSAAGRARVLLLLTDEKDNNTPAALTQAFQLTAEQAKKSAVSILTVLFPGSLQESGRFKPLFENNLSLATRGHLIMVTPAKALSQVFNDVLNELLNQILVSGTLIPASTAAADQQHKLTLAIKSDAIERDVVLAPSSQPAPPAPAASTPSGVSTGSVPPAPSAVVLTAPRSARKWLAALYAISALVGLLIFLLASLRQPPAPVPRETDATDEPKVVLAAVPRRPIRSATPSRAAEWLGARTDKLIAGGIAWLYSPRTRRTHLLAKLPLRVGNAAGSDVMLQMRGQSAGCEFNRDPHTGRVVVQPLNEQLVEIEGQRVTHSTPLSDRIRIRIGSEEFQFFEVRTGVERGS